MGTKLLHNWQPHMTRSTAKRIGIAVLCGLIGLAVDSGRQGSTAPLLLGRIVTLPLPSCSAPGTARRGLITRSRDAASSASASASCRSKRCDWLFARRGRSPMLAPIVWTAVAAVLVAVPSLYGVGYLRDTILPVACSWWSAG